ncbi:MAG: hypothetical protein ACHQRL_05705 [Gemmatimonadales bacterium]
MSVNALQKLKDVLPQLIGRRISRITIRQHDYGRTQLFLFFDDWTYYEFYSTSPIWGTREMDVGDIESIGSREYIPTHGALDVINRETAIIVERPSTPPL